MRSRREVITLLGGAAAAWPVVARAQQGRRVWRIGFLQEIALSVGNGRFLAFRDGLKEFGYLEGVNAIIDRREATGSRADNAALIKTMIAEGAEVIVASSTNSARAAQEVPKRMPIVMRSAADPVAVGLVASLARPGGNITGVTSQAVDLSAKRLEVLKELSPGLRRVAILWNPSGPAGRASMRETEVAALALGIDIKEFGVNQAAEFTEAFQSIVAGRFDAIDILAGAIITANRARILAFCSDARIPAVYQERPFAEAGGLLSYGPNFERLFHRMAYYVDRILKGAKPADLPVERSNRFELIINLKTARTLDLTVPPTLLARADEVIE